MQTRKTMQQNNTEKTESNKEKAGKNENTFHKRYTNDQ